MDIIFVKRNEADSPEMGFISNHSRQIFKIKKSYSYFNVKYENENKAIQNPLRLT